MILTAALTGLWVRVLAWRLRQQLWVQDLHDHMRMSQADFEQLCRELQEGRP